MTFDTTVHLSDILTTIIIPIVGYGALKVYTAVSTFVDRTDETADVVDMHTDVLVKEGWMKNMDVPKVGPIQRKKRSMFLGLAFALLAVGASAQEVIPTLTELRPLYPTPMSKPQISELLDRAALAHPGWKMLRKDAGNNCPTPNLAVHISCDWLFSPDGWGFDVLRDQEGVGQPGKWGDGPLAPGGELVAPWETGAVTPPPTPPVPPAPPQPPAPSYDFAAAFQRAYDQSERIYLDELNWRRDIGKQFTELTDTVNNPGWFKQVFSNRYVQLALAGVGSYFAMRMTVKPTTVTQQVVTP